MEVSHLPKVITSVVNRQEGIKLIFPIKWKFMCNVVY
jgi:hypothetical protein